MSDHAKSYLGVQKSDVDLKIIEYSVSLIANGFQRAQICTMKFRIASGCMLTRGPGTVSRDPQ